MGQFGDIVKRYVPQRPLDSADVGAVQIRLLGQAFLRPTPHCAQLADSSGELANGVIGNLLVLGPQPSSLKGCTLKVHSLK